MRVVLVALMMALVAIPAHARGKRSAAAQPQQNVDQKKKSAAEEKAYRDTLKRIPDQKPADPWGKMR